MPLYCRKEQEKQGYDPNINRIFKPFGIELDFLGDIVPISQYRDGGSITERHLLFALSLKLVQAFGKGQGLVDFLIQKMGIEIKPSILKYLLDKDNIFYEYDLLGLLKSDLVEKIYIDATDECPDVREVIAFSKISVLYPPMPTWEMWGILLQGTKGPRNLRRLFGAVV